MATVHIGQDAVLPCEVEGDSSPVVMWRKDGFPVRQDNNKYVLRFLAGVCNCIRHTRLYLSNTDIPNSFIFRAFQIHHIIRGLVARTCSSAE